MRRDRDPEAIKGAEGSRNEAWRRGYIARWVDDKARHGRPAGAHTLYDLDNHGGSATIITRERLQRAVVPWDELLHDGMTQAAKDLPRNSCDWVIDSLDLFKVDAETQRVGQDVAALRYYVVRFSLVEIDNASVLAWRSWVNVAEGQRGHVRYQVVAVKSSAEPQCVMDEGSGAAHRIQRMAAESGVPVPDGARLGRDERRYEADDARRGHGHEHRAVGTRRARRGAPGVSCGWVLPVVVVAHPVTHSRPVRDQYRAHGCGAARGGCWMGCAPTATACGAGCSQNACARHATSTITAPRTAIQRAQVINIMLRPHRAW